MTLVEGHLMARFSIANTPMSRGGIYLFSWIAPNALDTYFIILSVTQRCIKYHFMVTRDIVEHLLGYVQTNDDGQKSICYNSTWN